MVRTLLNISAWAAKNSIYYCEYLIFQGEVKVQVGKENMVFIQGPFSTFCVPALRSVYLPDITIYPGEQVSQYLHVHREDYRRALEVQLFWTVK